VAVQRKYSTGTAQRRDWWCWCIFRRKKRLFELVRQTDSNKVFGGAKPCLPSVYNIYILSCTVANSNKLIHSQMHRRSSMATATSTMRRRRKLRPRRRTSQLPLTGGHRRRRGARLGRRAQRHARRRRPVPLQALRGDGQGRPRWRWGTAASADGNLGGRHSASASSSGPLN
jgi:hypothetical protein